MLHLARLLQYSGCIRLNYALIMNAKSIKEEILISITEHY